DRKNSRLSFCDSKGSKHPTKNKTNHRIAVSMDWTAAVLLAEPIKKWAIVQSVTYTSSATTHNRYHPTSLVNIGVIFGSNITYNTARLAAVGPNPPPIKGGIKLRERSV